jgi:hypothetical protein
MGSARSNRASVPSPHVSGERVRVRGGSRVNGAVCPSRCRRQQKICRPGLQAGYLCVPRFEPAKRATELSGLFCRPLRGLVRGASVVPGLKAGPTDLSPPSAAEAELPASLDRPRFCGGGETPPAQPARRRRSIRRKPPRGGVTLPRRIDLSPQTSALAHGTPASRRLSRRRPAATAESRVVRIAANVARALATLAMPGLLRCQRQQKTCRPGLQAGYRCAPRFQPAKRATEP